MADAADDATVTRFSKCQEEYSIEDVDRLAFFYIIFFLTNNDLVEIAWVLQK